MNLATTRPARSRGQANVYTILVLIAFVALAAGVGITYWKSTELTKGEPGAGSPFYLLPSGN
jgi:flagellin-like protein